MIKNESKMRYDEKVKLELIQSKLHLLVDSFEKVLYGSSEVASQNSQIEKIKTLAGDSINKYMYWDWVQGVGLFGLWRIYEETRNQSIWDMLIKYYDKQIAVGLPSVNINTTAPLLALTYIYEITKNEIYGEICRNWAKALMVNLPRTKEDGFQHITSFTLNEEELWDDTLFMAVLFLARMGKILEKKEYIEESKYQLLLHIKYLEDKSTGLWFHGWTFKGNHNFTKALWARGNSWVTAMIPEFLNIIDCEAGIKKYFTYTLNKQIEALVKYQDESGMWHTLLDDTSSYLEASATCGFGYGILRAVHMKIVDEKYEASAIKALQPILNCIKDDGVVSQVSAGTAMGRESKQFYKDIVIKPMAYGQALAILFLLEVIHSPRVL